MIVRGTANFLVTLDGPKVSQRLAVLAGVCDVLALQEWGPNRNQMLDDLGRLVKWPRLRPIKPRDEWTFHRPRLGGGPIGVRNSFGETAISCRAVMLAGPGRVDQVDGRRTNLGPSWATRLKSRRADGSIVVRYNVHLTAGVQVGKSGYREDRPLRVARHRHEERPSLNRRVERDLEHGYDVEVYGDVNFHQMYVHRLVSWWAVRPHEGTLGPRAIDGIWTGRRPESVTFLPALVDHEHRHVLTMSES